MITMRDYTARRTLVNPRPGFLGAVGPAARLLKNLATKILGIYFCTFGY